MTTTATTQATGTGTTSAPPVNPSTKMDQNSFLKLLVAQLKYQDPLAPTSNSEFLQQQAQFSTVEALTNLEKTLGAMQSVDQLNQAVGLIGKSVDYVGADGQVASGTVASVSNTEGIVTLQVGTTSITPDAVIKVTTAAAPGGTNG